VAPEKPPVQHRKSGNCRPETRASQPNPPECRRFSHTLKSRRRDRTVWLGWKDSNLQTTSKSAAVCLVRQQPSAPERNRRRLALLLSRQGAHPKRAEGGGHAFSYSSSLPGGFPSFRWSTIIGTNFSIRATAVIIPGTSSWQLRDCERIRWRRRGGGAVRCYSALRCFAGARRIGMCL
jgi:hypothetical protein